VDDDEKFLRQAIELSRRNMSGQAGGPFGAIVVKDGIVIGEGWNRVTEAHDPSAHAEVSAIRGACAKLGTHALEGAVLYTSCEPCPMCLATAYWARLERIVWGNTREDAAAIGFDDEFLYQEVAKPPGQRSLPSRCLLRDEARAVFDSWSSRPDRMMY
jgi:guanine deaminase